MRRLVHLAFGAPALLLPSLGATWGAGIASCALLYNAFLAPHFGLDRAYRRPEEGHFGGLTTYPLAVLLLLLLAPLPIAAGAWVVLAVGDPTAAAVGQRLRRPRVPWNARKSLAGTLAATLAGAAACALVLGHAWTAHPWTMALAAGAAGAAVESLPLPIDDNLPVAGAAALALAPWLG
ncbi:MAG: hypothetical protein ACT4PV_05570 [Planctomycetaceae bacterium]